MTTADGSAGNVPEPASEQVPAQAAPTKPVPVSVAITFGQAFRWAVAAALGFTAVALLGVAMYTVRNILVLVTVALFIAVSLDPAVRWLVRKGLKRGYAVTIVTFALLALLVLFFWSVTPPLVRQGGGLVDKLPQYIQELPDRWETIRRNDRYHLTDRLSELTKNLPSAIGANALNFVGRFFGAVLSTLTVLVFTLYFMADLPRLRRGFVTLFPHRHRPQIADIVNLVVDKVGAYMIGNLVISFIAGVSTLAFLTILDVPYALPLALTVAICDLIPLIGATLGAAICVLVAVFSTELWPRGVVVAIFFVLYQQLENYYIAPRVLKNTVDISSIAVLLSALIGATVLGVVGALMAIPVAAAVKVVLSKELADRHDAALNTTGAGPPAAPGTVPSGD